jgi:hypothetical protein
MTKAERLLADEARLRSEFDEFLKELVFNENTKMFRGGNGKVVVSTPSRSWPTDEFLALCRWGLDLFGPDEPVQAVPTPCGLTPEDVADLVKIRHIFMYGSMNGEWRKAMDRIIAHAEAGPQVETLKRQWVAQNDSLCHKDAKPGLTKEECMRLNEIASFIDDKGFSLSRKFLRDLAARLGPKGGA